MELKVTTLEGKAAGTVDLKDDLFGLEVRPDILHRMVRYQQLKAMAGTHDVKNRSEGVRTGKKFVKQKGSGGARHGSARAPQFRGGGRAFGPVVRSHAHDLPKKVRALALRHALSAKAKGGGVVVWADASFDKPTTKTLKDGLAKLGFTSALVIDGAEVNENFALSARNIHTVDVLPVQGINVYDILRREKLVLTKAAVDALEARFK